jgi:hypothetical protein
LPSTRPCARLQQATTDRSLTRRGWQLYFGDRSKIFVYTRPWEALFRDPWWIFTVTNLFWVIKTQYDFTFVELVRVSPRFGVLLAAMLLSIAFLLVDILAVTHVFDDDSLPDGINPFWKLAFVVSPQSWLSL